MIRRWSYINDLNLHADNLDLFKKKFKIKIFKSSILFKRFTTKITKFKRKRIMRWKHQTNWLLYTSIFRLWIQDYMFYKRYLRFQYYNKFFVNNFLLCNLNFAQIKNENYSYNFNFFFFTLNKSTYYYFNAARLPYYKNNNIVIAYYLNTPAHDNSIVPTHREWEDALYVYNPNAHLIINDFDFELCFNFYFIQILMQLVEFNTILKLLWYRILFLKLITFVF